jgi:hypothetical protein
VDKTVAYVVKNPACGKLKTKGVQLHALHEFQTGPDTSWLYQLLAVKIARC